MSLGTASHVRASGRATDGKRGLRRLSIPDKLRMGVRQSVGVSHWVLISSGKRVRAQTYGQGPQEQFKLRQNEVTPHRQLGC